MVNFKTTTLINAMVNFSYEVINQIKDATHSSLVKSIVENSIHRFQTRNSGGFSAKRRFLMNLVMALRYIKAEGLNAQACENVSLAIEVIETLRKKEYGNFF